MAHIYLLTIYFVDFFSALILAGISRVFDLGTFSKNPEEELQKEISWLYRFVGKEPPDFTQPKNDDQESDSSSNDNVKATS